MRREGQFPDFEEIYEYIGTTQSNILYCYSGITYPTPDYEIIRKNSFAYSIEYIMEGSGVIQENDKIYTLSAGDFFILHPGTYHHYFSNPKNPWKKIFFVIEHEYKFIDGLLDLYKMNDVTLVRNVNSPLRLDKIFELLKSENQLSDLTLEKHIMNMIAELAHLLSNEPVNTSPVDRAKAFINTRIKTDLFVRDVAEYVNFDISYFGRIFKKEVGVTPEQYIIAQKLEIAKNLLSHTDASIKTISTQLAFYEPSYFSRLFKKYCGCSPLEYRKNTKRI